MNRRSFIFSALCMTFGAWLTRWGLRRSRSIVEDVGDVGVMVDLGAWHEMDQSSAARLIKESNWQNANEGGLLVPERFAEQLIKQLSCSDKEEVLCGRPIPLVVSEDSKLMADFDSWDWWKRKEDRTAWEYYNKIEQEIRGG